MLETLLGTRQPRYPFLALAVWFAIAVLMSLPALASAQSGATSQSSTSHTPQVARTILANGLNVVVVANHLAPAVTSIMNYNVGSREAPKGFPGMAHAQEHMMFRGTDSLSAAQISAIAAGMGGRFNAQTQDELTQYYFSVPAKYLNVALHLQAARMKSVADKPAAWKQERGAIEKEVGRDLSNPGYVAHKRMLQQLFNGTPYSHDALGTKASFDKTKASMLKSFYNTWYAPNNATLVIAGDVNPKRVVAKVRHLFGGIQSKKLPKRPRIELSSVNTSPIHMTTDRGWGLAYLAFRTPGTSNASTYATMKVLARILNDPRGRLYSQLVVSGQSLGTLFSVRAMRQAGIAYVAAGFAKGADSQALVKHLKTIVAHIARKGVTAQQVAAAKRQLKTHAAARQDSIAGQASRWSRAVAKRQYDSPPTLMNHINKVSADQVNQLAKQLLGSTSPHVLTVLTPGHSGHTSSGRGYGGKESFTPQHVGKVSLPTWAAQPLQSITAPKPTFDPQPTTLANGLKLITVTRKSVKAAHVYGRIRHNAALEQPKGQAGVAAVLGRMLKFGTQKRGRRAYEAALNRIGASSSAGTQFSLTVLPRYFQQGLSLLAEKQRHPALPARVFPVVQHQIASAVAGQLQSPGFQAGQALKKGLYPAHDPSLRHATPQSLQSLSRQDVVAYHKHVFRPDRTTLVVVSNLPPSTVKQAVKKAFGTWRAKGKAPNVTLGPVPANKAHTIHVADSAKSQDQVTLAQTLDVAGKPHLYHALQLGTQVLTGEFYASRLYRELRAERGLVYTINSQIGLGRKRSTLSFVFGASPKHVAQADKIIRQTLTDMANNPVTASELHRARAGLVRQVPLNAASAGSIGSGLLRSVRLNLPLDAPYRAERDYLHISAQGIKKAFKTHVRPGAQVQVIQGPAPGGSH